MKRFDFRPLVRAALREDRAFADVTGKWFVPRGLRARAVVVAREPGVAAGVAAAALAFRERDPRLAVHVLCPDGRRFRRHQPLLEAKGSLRSLLAAERTALNILSALSGVATLTRRFVDAAGPRGPAILDTRKTIPGLRAAQKWAVLQGGGVNHRRDLAAAVLIKENHLSVIRTPAHVKGFFRRVAALRARGVPVEMECRNKKEIQWGLAAGADILLLDNFSPRRLPAVVRWINGLCRRRGRPLLEVSGGVDLAAVKVLARSGVDRISVGRLTHSARSLDINMDIKLEEKR
jgi:nicotinate-nucleotide pyrophosphorylase (carboxylating)